MARQMTCDACHEPIEDGTGFEQWSREYRAPTPNFVPMLTSRVRITVKTSTLHDADLHRTCAEAIFAATLAAMRQPEEAKP